MPIAKLDQTSINYGEYTRGKNQSNHWLGKAKYSYGKGCRKHEIMLEGQVLEQEDSDKVQGNFLVECLCMFLFHYTNLVEMQCTHIRFHIFCSSFACFHYVE